MKFLIKILIALDYFLNAFAPASPCGMTISSHAGMAAMDGRRWGLVVRGVLDRIQPNHCELSMRDDAARSQAVINQLKPYLTRINKDAAT